MSATPNDYGKAKLVIPESTHSLNHASITKRDLLLLLNGPPTSAYQWLRNLGIGMLISSVAGNVAVIVQVARKTVVTGVAPAVQTASAVIDGYDVALIIAQVIPLSVAVAMLVIYKYATPKGVTGVESAYDDCVDTLRRALALTDKPDAPAAPATPVPVQSPAATPPANSAPATTSSAVVTPPADGTPSTGA